MRDGDQKGDGDPESTFPVEGAPFPTCLWPVPKSLCASAPARVGVSMVGTEQSLGAGEPTPHVMGHEASLLRHEVDLPALRGMIQVFFLLYTAPEPREKLLGPVWLRKLLV